MNLKENLVEAVGVELFSTLIPRKLLNQRSAKSAKKPSLPNQRYKNGTKSTLTSCTVFRLGFDELYHTSTTLERQENQYTTTAQLLYHIQTPAADFFWNCSFRLGASTIGIKNVASSAAHSLKGHVGNVGSILGAKCSPLLHLVFVVEEF